MTYRGGDGGKRTFNILFDNKKIATQRLDRNRPDKFYEETYAPPVGATAGKQRNVVRFEPHPGNMAGGVYGVRLVKK